MSTQDPVVLLVCDDLFFRVKLEELIRQSGRTAVTVSSRASFDDLPTYAVAAVVDLNLSAIPALEAIQLLRERRPSIPVIAFGPHVERGEPPQGLGPQPVLGRIDEHPLAGNFEDRFDKSDIPGGHGPDPASLARHGKKNGLQQ